MKDYATKDIEKQLRKTIEEYGKILMNSLLDWTQNQTLGSERIILFVGYLIDNNRKSSTIKSYVSAIKAILQEDGVVLDNNEFIMNSLTRACKLINDKVITRLPIKKSMLYVLLANLDRVFTDQPFLKILFQALFSTAYFGLLRVGEITTGNHPILARDVHIADNKNKILFVLRSSKTHGRDAQPQTVKITSKRKDEAEIQKSGNVFMNEKSKQYCPYKLLKAYLEVRGPYHQIDEPFFVFSDHSPVMPVHMRKCLKTILKFAGFTENLYGTHGFRSGRASDLLICGLSVESIRKIGRWSSNAVYKYLKC